MENLWKLKEMSFRVSDLADRAEYDRLLKRFHEEEVRVNLRNLLYGGDPPSRPEGGEVE